MMANYYLLLLFLLPTALPHRKLVQLPLQLAEQAFELSCDDEPLCTQDAFTSTISRSLAS